MQRFGEVEQLVGLHLQPVGQHGQIGPAVERLGGQGFQQAGHLVGGDGIQHHADAGAGYAGIRGGLRFGAPGHVGVDAVDQLAEGGVEAVARVRQGRP